MFYTSALFFSTKSGLNTDTWAKRCGIIFFLNFLFQLTPFRPLQLPFSALLQEIKNIIIFKYKKIYNYTERFVCVYRWLHIVYLL